MNTPPIACTLPGNQFAERVTLIGELNGAHLRRHSREGPTLTLTYAASATPRLRELVARERLCCAFLRFDLVENTGAGDVTVLRVEAPDVEATAIDALLSPFLEGATPSTAELRRET